jgi:hypothetical protein
MATQSKANTTARGLGWKHQQIVATLIRKLTDGTLCWWCGLPMFKDKHHNWDHLKLAGDHTVPRIHGGTRADRLLHATCNKKRGDGSRDDKRPALTGTHPDRKAETPVTIPLAMDW